MARNTIPTLLVSLLVFVVISCGVKKAKTAEDLRSQCCKECVEAFSQSPVGVGAEGARCGSFNSAVELSSPCQKYFSENPVMVSECQ
ncbi:MAG: hypothetical protein HRU41_04815 [Saprospiraceae bacterium]|nr:hypothetical protein [Saprospiraceae bacterium]